MRSAEAVLATLTSWAQNNDRVRVMVLTSSSFWTPPNGIQFLIGYLAKKFARPRKGGTARTDSRYKHIYNNM